MEMNKSQTDVAHVSFLAERVTLIEHASGLRMLSTQLNNQYNTKKIWE